MGKMRGIHILLATVALSASAGEHHLFDGGNYPWRPKAFKGAEVGDYAKTRVMDIRFAAAESGVQIQALRGDRQSSVAEWMTEGAELIVELKETPNAPPPAVRVEVAAQDRTVQPSEKRIMTGGPVETSEAAVRGGARELRFKMSGKDVGPNFAPASVKLVGTGPGRLVVTRVIVRGPKITDDRLPAPPRGDDRHVWLRVKGRRIVTSPLAEGGERPFVPVGVGYGKDVILHGYDEEVAAYCKRMGFNTIRLAFYHRTFNSRPDEPLEFRDIVGFIDPLVAAARRHGLYVILDDHAYFKNEIDEANARGEQASGGWTTAAFEQWVRRWGEVAEYYRDEPYVLGYELCNEPVCEPEVARKWYQRAIAEIRRHDRRHIVIVGTHHWSHSRAMEATWAGIADKLDEPYGNVVFAFHDYPLDDTPQKVRRYLADFQNRYDVPVMCTEFGCGGTPEPVHRETQAGMLALFAQEGIGWMIWTLQDVHGKGRSFPTRAEKTPDKKWRVLDGPGLRYDIPYVDIWAPVASIVASPFPRPAEKKSAD